MGTRKGEVPIRDWGWRGEGENRKEKYLSICKKPLEDPILPHTKTPSHPLKTLHLVTGLNPTPWNREPGDLQLKTGFLNPGLPTGEHSLLYIPLPSPFPSAFLVILFTICQNTQLLCMIMPFLSPPVCVRSPCTEDHAP